MKRTPLQQLTKKVEAASFLAAFGKDSPCPVATMELLAPKPSYTHLELTTEIAQILGSTLVELLPLLSDEAVMRILNQQKQRLGANSND